MGIKFAIKIITTICIVIILMGAFFFFYQRSLNAEFACDKVVSKFTSLLSNQTDVITPNEKETLKSITQTGVIGTIQYEQIMLKLRKFNANYTINSGPVVFTKIEKTYGSSNINFTSKTDKNKSFIIILQLENIQNQWFGDKCSIFKIDIPKNPENIDTSVKDILQNIVIDKAKTIQEEGSKILNDTIKNISK